MKVLLAVTLVLLSARLGYTDFIEFCRTEEEYNKPLANHPISRIAYLNIIRASTAKVHQIANMHELKYDMALEKEARKMKSCDDIKHGVNYRVDFYGRKESDPIWKEFVKNSANKTASSYTETDHPLLTSFIECELTTICSMETIIANEPDDNFKPTFIILYGWRGTLSLSDLQHGPPGSKCTHGTTEHGLCIAPPRSEIETTAPSRSNSEAIGSSSGNNGESEGLNSVFVYLSIAFMSLFL
ncbi:hypothetical protein CRE_16345 [Caenorhabditis remanei]|uniref:SCP domain-containing protein n=1 Tax=Caenorhabditis remanei TaxID=31234 RepID=E3NC75_CAERE|nr:hypothetical protein CRE_16345 [Caenorhabditis remanei]